MRLSGCRYAVIIAVIALAAAVHGEDLLNIQKLRVGYGEMVPTNVPNTPESMWDSANVVIEAIALELRPAIERDPTAPPKYKTAWTPAVIQIKDVLKNELGIPLTPGMSLTVFELFGRVEGPDYYIEMPGKEEFELGLQHFVFLRCGKDLSACEVATHVLKIRGDRLENERLPSELRGMGTSGFRKRLAALKAKR